MKKVYISGKISGKPIEETKRKFAEAEERLRAEGYEVLSPLKNGLPLESDYSSHMIIDLLMLFQADAIYMLHDWSDSRGAITELAAARATGKLIMYECDPKYDVIMKTITDITGVSKQQVLSKARCVEYVHARIMLSQLMSENGANISEIRKYLCKQYSSILHYLEVYKTEIKTNRRFRELDEAVRHQLKNEINFKQ